jgi:hypothetical protein
MKKDIFFGLVLFFLMMWTVFAEPARDQKPEWKGTIKDESGVQIIKNPVEPIYGENILILDEELSIGEENGKGEYLFSEIRSPWASVAVDKQDRIYVLDVRERHVLVFDNSGKLLKTIGRRGQGPGEFQYAHQILISAQDEIIVEDPRMRRLTYFSLEGEYIKTVSLSNADIADINIDSAGNILGIAVIEEGDNPRYELKKFSPNFEYLGTLDTAPYKVETLAEGLNPWGYGSLRFCVLEDGRVLSGFSQKYELRLFSRDGDLIKTISKEYAPVKITQDEIEARTKRHVSIGGPPPKFVIPKYHLPFSSFLADDEGRIFVARSGMTKDRGQRHYDVFDPTGKCICRTSFGFLPQVWKNGKLYAIDENEEGYQFIKRFRVDWKF